jgi:hypothetical protein
VLALAYLQAGATGVPGARFVAGPFATTRPDGEVSRELLGVFAGELSRLVELLPGAPIEHVYVGNWRGAVDDAELERAVAAVQQLGELPSS